MPRPPDCTGLGQAGPGVDGSVSKLHKLLEAAARLENRGLFCSPVSPQSQRPLSHHGTGHLAIFLKRLCRSSLYLPTNRGRETLLAKVQPPLISGLLLHLLASAPGPMIHLSDAGHIGQPKRKCQNLVKGRQAGREAGDGMRRRPCHKECRLTCVPMAVVGAGAGGLDRCCATPRPAGLPFHEEVHQLLCQIL